MKFLFASVLILSLNAFSSETPHSENTDVPKRCREAVVEASLALKTPLDPQAFSVLDATEFNMSMEDFNALSSSEQSSIYMKIKPLEVMVEEMIQDLTGTIDYLKSDPYTAFFQIELIENLRTQRDQLRSCI